MFQRALVVLFAFLVCDVGNAGQAQLSQPTVAYPQESVPSMNPEGVKKGEPIAKISTATEPETPPATALVNLPSASPTNPPAVAPVAPAPTAPVTTLTTPSAAAPMNPPAGAPGTPPAAVNVTPQNGGTLELLPHRATYSITLDKNYYDEDIAEAKGQMTIQLAKAGDGWAIEQKSTLHIYYKDGSAEQVITNLATYESTDGLKYSFNARTLRGDQEESISGDAIIASKGGAGIVTYQQPDESTIQLPVGTIFPTQHLIYMLEAAMRGQKVVSNIVFDGSSETHEPVQVDTILGPSQDPKLALTNKDLLQAKKVYPMRMAIYAVDSNGPEADYEITQHVLDRGIIRDMTLDYGTFKVKAVLNQVEVFS